MKLTDAKLRTLAKAGKHFDGNGLYLEITAAGGRYWRLKYRYAGKEKRLALGVYPAISLKDARELAAQARQTLAAGADPGEIKQQAKAKAAQDAANTLRLVAAEWLKHQAGRWAPITAARVQSSLDADILKDLGDMPINTVTPRHIIKAVKKVEARGASEAASRLMRRVKSIYRWAYNHQRIDTDPMLGLLPAEIIKPREVTHRAALPEKELPAFLSKLEHYEGEPITVLALRLLMLTATRSGELRGAKWAEFDLDNAMWTIPAERMKMKTEHKVPLSRQALQVLQQAQAIGQGTDLVFASPSYRSKPLSDNTFNSALARMGYKGQATAHGFRALFSSIANECNWDADVIERQLAHEERNKVRAAYHRSAYTEERARLLQWWADYLDGAKAGKVLKMRRKAC